MKDEVWHALIVVISNASELHGYAVRALYQAFQRSAEQVLFSAFTKSVHALDFLFTAIDVISLLNIFHQETLVRVAVWCIGEYGDFLINNVGMLDVEDPITVSKWFLLERLYIIFLT